GPEDRVHRAVAGRIALVELAGRHLDRDPRTRVAPGSGLHLEPLERVGILSLAHLVGDDRLEVERRDLLLLVGDLLEAPEGLVERVAVDLEAELGQSVPKGVPARMLAEDD